MTDFAFHRAPRAHQLRDFERFKDAPYFFLTYDPRVGKTKPVLDIFRYRCGLGEVDALIVVAYPNGTHRIWGDELPKEFPLKFLRETASVMWRSGKMSSQTAQRELDDLLLHRGPIVLALNCEALLTETALGYLRRLFAKRKVMLVADEASWAANWSARTRKLLAMGRHPHVVIKAALDGTPASEGVTDLFYPVQFLTPRVFGTSMMAYKNRYIQYEETTSGERKKGYNRRTGTEYDIPIGVRNLDELHAKFDAIGSRVRREDVTDAPEKIYSTRYFELTEKQRRVYDRLRGEYVLELQTGDLPVSVVLTRMLRLQMICRNYVPPQRGGEECRRCAGSGYDTADTECEACQGLGIVVATTALERIDSRSPALEALAEELRIAPGPIVVWAHFRQDVTDALSVAGPGALRYDGSISAQEREDNYQSFRAGRADVICGTITSGLSRGKDLRRATTLIYYSNTFSRRARTQSEDRAEALDRTTGTEVIDLVAADTRDLTIIEALREKRDLEALIVGDAPTRWL